LLRWTFSAYHSDAEHQGPELTLPTDTLKIMPKDSLLFEEKRTKARTGE
jgi:hypothetical protein